MEKYEETPDRIKQFEDGFKKIVESLSKGEEGKITDENSNASIDKICLSILSDKEGKDNKFSELIPYLVLHYMSDEELEYYREKEISELKAKQTELEVKKKELDERYSDAYAARNAVDVTYNCDTKLTPYDRYEYGNILEQHESKVNNLQSKVYDIEDELSRLGNKIDEILSLTCEELKERIINERLGGSFQYSDYSITAGEPDDRRIESTLEQMVSDSSTVREFVSSIDELKEIDKKLQDLSFDVDIGNHIPNDLKKIIREYLTPYDSTSNPGMLYDTTLSQYEHVYKGLIDEHRKLLRPEMVMKLVGPVEDSEVDMEWLEKNHLEHVDKKELKRLRTLVLMRDAAKAQKASSPDLDIDPSVLDEQIIESKKIIYNSIRRYYENIDWHGIYSIDGFSNESNSPWSSEESMNKLLESLNEGINITETSIKTLLESAKQAKSEHDALKGNYLNRKQELEGTLRDILSQYGYNDIPKGIDVTETDIYSRLKKYAERRIVNTVYYSTTPLDAETEKNEKFVFSGDLASSGNGQASPKQAEVDQMLAELGQSNENNSSEMTEGTSEKK